MRENVANLHVDMINQFQKGQSHMALVVEPTKKVPVGVITLEDVIEEMIQEEIIDETDQYIDIHAKIKVDRDSSEEVLNSRTSLEPEARPLLAKETGAVSRVMEESAQTGASLDSEDTQLLKPEGFGRRKTVSRDKMLSEQLPFKKGTFKEIDQRPITIDAWKKRAGLPPARGASSAKPVKPSASPDMAKSPSLLVSSMRKDKSPSRSSSNGDPNQ